MIKSALGEIRPRLKWSAQTMDIFDGYFDADRNASLQIVIGVQYATRKLYFNLGLVIVITNCNWKEIKLRLYIYILLRAVVDVITNVTTLRRDERQANSYIGDKLMTTTTVLRQILHREKHCRETLSRMLRENIAASVKNECSVDGDSLRTFDTFLHTSEWTNDRTYRWFITASFVSVACM